MTTLRPRRKPRLVACMHRTLHRTRVAYAPRHLRHALSTACRRYPPYATWHAACGARQTLAKATHLVCCRPSHARLSQHPQPNPQREPSAIECARGGADQHYQHQLTQCHLHAITCMLRHDDIASRVASQARTALAILSTVQASPALSCSLLLSPIPCAHHQLSLSPGLAAATGLVRPNIARNVRHLHKH